MQAVWAKSCRGAMVRYILNNQLLTPEELAGFSYEGFEYEPELGEAAFPHFVRLAVDFQGDNPSQHLSDDEYEHDDSADSLRVELP